MSCCGHVRAVGGAKLPCCVAAAAARLLLCWFDFMVPAGVQWVGRRAPTRACRAASRVCGTWLAAG